MNLHTLLQSRAASGNPVRVGLIGAGKFGSMFLAQIPTTDGLEVSVIADLNVPAAGLAHAELALEHGKHIIMVNVEADVLAGPLMAAKFNAAGLVYSMAYGDQPALTSELVDWARATGLR